MYTTTQFGLDKSSVILFKFFFKPVYLPSAGWPYIITHLDMLTKYTQFVSFYLSQPILLAPLVPVNQKRASKPGPSVCWPGCASFAVQCIFGYQGVTRSPLLVMSVKNSMSVLISLYLQLLSNVLYKFPFLSVVSDVH